MARLFDPGLYASDFSAALKDIYLSESKLSLKAFLLKILPFCFYFSENCGFFFPEIKRNLGKYVYRCPESVRRWLRQLKDAGKITMLITSSHSDYCKLLGTYILG